MIAASVAFIVLIGISMILYPGGNLIDRSSVHFNFFLNFLSDLGSTFSHSGKQNTASQVFFIIAMGMYGLVMIYYSRIWRGMDIEVHQLIIIGIPSKVFFALAGLCFIGLAFTPWNINFESHVMLFKTAIVCILAWTVLILILQFRNEKIRGLFSLNLLFAAILLTYSYLLFYNPQFGTDKNIELHAVSQKAVLLVLALDMLFQSVGLLHFLRRADFRRSGMKNFYV